MASTRDAVDAISAAMASRESQCARVDGVKSGRGRGEKHGEELRAEMNVQS